MRGRGESIILKVGRGCYFYLVVVNPVRCYNMRAGIIYSALKLSLRKL
jgi:hypothetical protein